MSRTRGLPYGARNRDDARRIEATFGSSCAPYARVHREVELKQVSEVLLQEVRDTYASYEDNQPGYVKDVESAYVAADSAWRAYRDAHCALEQVVQSMSRQEAPWTVRLSTLSLTALSGARPRSIPPPR